MKKSFILHIDSLGILDELSDEQAGQLFKLIYAHHNPNKPKETQITQLVNLAFYPFKSQFDRDFQTYQGIVERNKKNGLVGGRPKKNNPKKPKKADSDNVSDSVSDSKNENNKELQIFDNFRKEYLGTKLGNETEFKNFQKHSDWKAILPKLQTALKLQIENRNAKRQRSEFVPEWKNLKTWINQRCWEEVIEENKELKYPRPDLSGLL